MGGTRLCLVEGRLETTGMRFSRGLVVKKLRGSEDLSYHNATGHCTKGSRDVVNSGM